MWWAYLVDLLIADPENVIDEVEPIFDVVNLAVQVLSDFCVLFEVPAFYRPIKLNKLILQLNRQVHVIIRKREARHVQPHRFLLNYTNKKRIPHFS